MPVVSRRKVLGWCAVGAALLLAANAPVAVVHAGSRAGQTYRWVCRDSGAELSYNPSEFGSARLTPGRSGPTSRCRWELIEPRPPSPLLPWNWLALLLERPAPDAETVIRQQNLDAN